jgi:8-oxo-dGTP pyrophosphatase MutT (NUDIX family)
MPATAHDMRYNRAMEPRPAATIILVRPPFDVLLIKRHGKSGFMGGASVFPGGRVEESDALSGEALAHAHSIVDHERAGAFVAAAVRETKEEAGIDVDPMKLQAWSWWVTPKEEPKRFDTRFFIAPVAAGTVDKIDDHEAVASVWLSPQGALAAYERGEISLAPPTLATLEDLSPFASFDEAAQSVRKPLRAICPRIVSEESLILALPGDPLHDEKTAVFANRTRIVMDGGGKFRSAVAGS